MKEQIKAYWNKGFCGKIISSSPKYSRQYFDDIEDYRYNVEPEIFKFAQFTRYYGQKVLEVGIGAGTDFIQWVRAGTRAYGIDLTEGAVEHTKKALDVYGLSAEEIKVADAENLPYEDNSFDLVYSWGVIHHTPNTVKALEEIIRVTRLGGRIKIMVYNRRSLFAFYTWLYYGLLRGKPFRSIQSILCHHLESIGTKAFTFREVRNILSKYPIKIKAIHANVTSYDLLPFGFDRIGWFMTIELEKKSPSI